MHFGKRMLKMGLPGKRRRGKPKWSFMDEMRDDMWVAGVTEEDTENRTRWKLNKLWRLGTSRKKNFFLPHGSLVFSNSVVFPLFVWSQKKSYRLSFLSS